MISSSRLRLASRVGRSQQLRLGAANNSRSSSTLGRSSRPLAVSLRRLLLQQRFYSTDRILEWRNSNITKNTKTLYNAAHEKENCGVGLIASLKSEPARMIVEKADEMLVRMAHRGGCGCDPASGDGSGKTTLCV